LTDIQPVGGDADAQVVARWLDEGIAPTVRMGERSVSAESMGLI